MTDMGSCLVCEMEPAVAVVAIPGLPISVPYGRGCLEANAHPYQLLVANTATIGGIEHAALWWRDMVNDTVTHLRIEPDQFNLDVRLAIARDRDLVEG